MLQVSSLYAIDVAKIEQLLQQSFASVFPQELPERNWTHCWIA